MTPPRLFILLVTLALFPAALCHGAPPMPADGNVSIRSDAMSQDTANETFTATGHVTIKWKAMTLTADKATYNRTTRVLTATGNVEVKKDTETLKGKSITLDMDTGRGELDKGVLSSTASNITFTGEKISRINDNEIELTTSELTTCDLPDPSWKFGADRLQVNMLGYAVGRGVTFYIKDVPVLYLPWIAFPAVRERRTGLLFPRVGYSNKRGAQLDLPLYLVISPSQDLLLNLDIQTRRGVGVGADYRYFRTRGSEGEFNGYLIYDLVKAQWRGRLDMTHKEIFSPTLNVRADIHVTSDRDFLNDFGEENEVYNRQSNETTINALKTWQHYALSGYLHLTEDLYAPNNSHTVQTLPEIALAGVRQQILSTPVYFDLDSSIANLYRSVDPIGQRAQAFPRLTYVTGLPGYLNIEAYAGVQARGYVTHDSRGGTANANVGDLLPETGARASTSLSRVYEVDGASIKKLRHELTPELSYTYAPEHDQSRLPFYDYNDRLVQQNILYASVTSFLGGKFQVGDTTTYRDISRIKLTQGYSIEGTRRDLLTMVDANRHLTDLMLESETWLHPLAKLTFDARYDVYDSRFSSAAPGLEMDDKQGDTAGVSYRMARDQLGYLEARLATKHFSPWTLGYATRYSFDRGEALESVYSVEYKQKCWSVTVAITSRPGNPFSLHFSFNLEGLLSSK